MVGFSELIPEGLIRKKAQGDFRHFPALYPAKAAAGVIPRIGVIRPVLVANPMKITDPHKYFTADRRGHRSGQAQRNAPNGPDIGADVVSHFAIRPGSTARARTPSS